MSVKSKVKLARIVLGSTVGSLLWAGCAEPRVAVHDPRMIAYAPVDLTKRRPDTNPELRTGLWQMTSDTPTTEVVLVPTVKTPDALPGAADPAYLLAYSWEAINAVPPEGQGAIITEAAGAERSPRRTWRFRRSAPPASKPAPVERHEEHEIIIERQMKSIPYKPSSDELEEEEGGKLLKSTFVRK
ncbi:MAG: hypothetical protein H0X66_19110 [Verrucomicrobia bacterium]|nr:hypothetical protein [Verrucomicrobiota bacterium]